MDDDNTKIEKQDSAAADSMGISVRNDKEAELVHYSVIYSLLGTVGSLLLVIVHLLFQEESNGKAKASFLVVFAVLLCCCVISVFAKTDGEKARRRKIQEWGINASYFGPIICILGFLATMVDDMLGIISVVFLVIVLVVLIFLERNPK